MDSPLKWHGGKRYLASKLWNLARTVPHKHRVEVFGGSLAFTLATEPEGYSEVVNDVNEELMNFWTVLREDLLFDRFRRRVEATPFSEQVYLDAPLVAASRFDLCWVRAWAFFVQCRQSLAGRMQGFAPLSRTRTRRGMNEQASAWLSAVEGLPAVHERLKRVAILCRDACNVILSQDGPDTLFYLDPPYIPDVRAGVGEYGEHEMSEADHENLLNLVVKCQGKFMISGYLSDLYDVVLRIKHGWRSESFELPNNAAGGKEKRRMLEYVWKNF